MYRDTSLLSGTAKRCLLAIGVSSIALAAPAFAGEADNSDEIVVTARKTSERLQDVPISVSAVSGDQLSERGAVDVKDVMRSIPGLSFSNVERGLGNYNIRGISTVASSPTVGIYLDDIPLTTLATTFSGAFDPIFFDMERLEVLKGPQGTLYGGSSMGGAIKYVSARPNSSAFSASAGVGLATTAHGDPSYNAEGIVNVPLVEGKLAMRAGVFYRPRWRLYRQRTGSGTQLQFFQLRLANLYADSRKARRPSARRRTRTVPTPMSGAFR